MKRSQSIVSTLLFSMLAAGCGGGAATVVPSASSFSQSGATSASRITSSAALQKITATTSGWKLVSVQTTPGARCVMQGNPGSDNLVTYADSSGRVDLYVTAIKPQPNVSTALACTSGQTVQNFPLVYQHGNVTPDVSTAAEKVSTQKSEATLNAQAQSATSRLGFDPRTQTNDFLAAHDLPARPNAPSSSSAYQSWLDVATTPATKIIRQGVTTDIYHPVQAASACAGCGNYGTTSNNWAGYMGYGYQGTFGLISAQWTMPTAVVQMPAGTYYDATWVGIDGGSNLGKSVQPNSPFPIDNSNVFQTGTWTQVVSNGGYQTGTFSIWYEWFPKAAQTVFYTAPGDSDWCEVFKFFSGGRAAAEWYCRDTVSGETEITAQYVDSAMNGATGEWIVERPEPNINQPGVYGPLVNFGSTTLTNAWAETTTGVWFPYSQLGGPWALYDISLYNGRYVEAQTANQSYLNFDVVWEASQ